MTVIHVNFTEAAKHEVYNSMKYLGIKRTREGLLYEGWHPSYVEAMIKHIMKYRGW